MNTFLSDLLERPINHGVILKDRYQIIHFIAKGSYGLTYLADDLTANSKVVVKQLRKRKRTERQGIFEREAMMLQTLNHQSIPKYIDLFQIEREMFLVMEFVEGENVEELIFYEHKTFNEQESLAMFLKVLKVVQYIHEVGIIHRDLRLPNILIRNHHVFIIDFGLAVFSHEKVPASFQALSIEKRLFREISYTSDFYALGHFLLFLLYSNYQATSHKKRSWEEELILKSETASILRKLLKLDSCYEHVSDIIADVENALREECIPKE